MITLGRARKQKHGPATTDGKGRSGTSADTSMTPRQAFSAARRHGVDKPKKEKP